MLPVSEKGKVLDLVRGRICVLRLLRSTVMTNLLFVKCEGREIHASLAAAPQTAKLMATVRDKCLVKMKKALDLEVGNRNRKRAPADGSFTRKH